MDRVITQKKNKSSDTKDKNSRLVKIQISWPKYIFVIMAMLAILFGNIAHNYKKEFKNEMAESYRDYMASINAVESRVKTINDLDKLYRYYDEEYAVIYGKAVKTYMDSFGFSADSLKSVSGIEEGAKLYMTRNKESGTYYSFDKDVIRLTEEQIEMVDSNSLVIDGLYYDTVTCNEGTVLVKWDKTLADITSGRNIIDICEGNAFVYNPQKGDITNTDEVNLSVIYDSFEIEEVTDVIKPDDPLISLGKVYMNPGKTFIGYGVSKKIDESTVVCTYFTDDYIKNKAINKILFPSILKIVFMMFFVICVFVFLKYSYIVEDEENYVSISNTRFISKLFISRVSSLLIVGMILFSIFTYYVSNLVYYSNQNMVADSDLNFMRKNIENNEYDREVLTTEFQSMIINYAKCISVFLAGAQGTEEELSLERLRKIFNLEEISIYNDNGVIVNTTTNYNGYSLSADETTDENRLWSLINGGSLTEYYVSEENSALKYAAVRRIDSPGLVKIGVISQGMDAIVNTIDFQQSVIDSDFNASAKVYVDVNDESKLYWNDNGSRKIKVLQNTLSGAESLKNGYAGAQKINGGTYYINVLREDNYILISCEEIGKVKEKGLRDTVSDVLIILLSLVLLIVTTMIQKGKIEEISECEYEDGQRRVNAEHELKHLQKLLRLSLNILVLICLLCLATFLVGTDMIGNNSFIYYLINGSWDRGINIFSVTVIIMTFFLTAVFIVVEKRIFKLLCNNLGVQSITIGYLISSILKVLALGLAIFYSLLQVGIDTRTLLASVGIGGLVLGMGAKDIVADLLAGIFIVFEGHICVGEWITVGDFHGIVTDMGIRTTKVTDIGGKIKSIPNSEMRNVINYSRSLTWVGVNVCLKKDTDLEFLARLIDANEDRFVEKIECIKKKPQYSYVDDITRDGIDVIVSTYCDEADYSGCRRMFREEVFELLRENNLIQDGVSVKLVTQEEMAKIYGR